MTRFGGPSEHVKKPSVRRNARTAAKGSGKWRDGCSGAREARGDVLSTPFDDGRVGIMFTDLSSFTIPYANVPAWATDIFLPAHDPKLTSAKYNEIKNNAAIRGTKTQLWWDATHTTDGASVAEAVHAKLNEIPQHSGGVEVDLEAANDGPLSTLISGFYTRFRQLRPTRALAINVVPLKGYVMPLQAMAQDIFCHVRVQTYYGAELRPADPDECEDDIVNRGFPRERYSICYSAKPRRLKDDTIFCDLPVFTDHGAYTRRLRKGQIFSANLMREGGLL
jgi:hypothetical protein